MKKRNGVGLLAISFMVSGLEVSANTNVGSFDAAQGTGPTSQGWSDNTSLQGSGALVTEQGASAWQADGTGGRAVWKIVPTTAQNSDASTNGWSMSWTSRMISGEYVTN